MHVRPANEDDLYAVAVMAGELVRFHHALAPRRFIPPPAAGLEQGYRGWLDSELKKSTAMFYVAVGDDRGLVGYLYAREQPRDWMKLVDAHVALIDIYVHPPARRSGVADALIEALLAEAKTRGAPRVLLETAAANEAAQALFVKHGFAPSMIEMMRPIE
ncbi:MAG: N-acetyltransferase family protein [Sandaracinaceae bacterium]